MKLLLCVALACVVVSVKASNCEVDPARRVNCGAKTKDDCESRNCCFDESFVAGGPGYRCFHPVNPCLMPNPCLYGAQCVNTPTHPSYDDGAYDCICPADQPAGTNCRARQGDCNVQPTDRVACGLVVDFKDIVPNYDPAVVCASRGCCYNDSIPKTKWCFHPNKVEDPELPQCTCSQYSP